MAFFTSNRTASAAEAVPFTGPLISLRNVEKSFDTAAGRSYVLRRISADTADSTSPSLTTTDVGLSLALYIVVYLIMFPTGILFMARLVARGPQQEEPSHRIESNLARGPFESAARAAPES